MMGRHVDALWTIKRKRWVVALVDEGALNPGNLLSRDAFDKHKVNAMRQEMVVLTELGLYKLAYELAAEIEAEPAYLCNASYLISALTWDRLNAMQHLPRVGLCDARRMTHAAGRVSERLCDDWQPLAQLLVARSFANVCLSHGHAQEARTVLKDYVAMIDRIPYCGAFHKVMFLRAWARAGISG